jgi:hypothetical protein
MFRHLQHVPLPWRAWDSPFYLEDPVPKLVASGQKLGIAVDQSQSNQQHYLNHLHQIYERAYDGNPLWLDFHEHIHMCERDRKSILTLDYRELSGPIRQSFDHAWLESAVTRIPAGSVFVSWSELGKSPYRYWQDQEQDCLERMCELAKPWIYLRGKLEVALEDIDSMDHLEQDLFRPWWEARSSDWCQYWNIPKWTLEQQRAMIIVGHIPPDDLGSLTLDLQQGQHPTHVVL